MQKYNPTEPDENFVKWILSINKSWRDRTTFQPFEDYKNQCEDWIKENLRVHNFEPDSEEQRQAILKEGSRVKENSLYYMKKYNWYVEASANGGKLKTTTCEVQDVMCFLIDYGCSMLIAKARGIRSTSTFLPVAGMKVRRYKNMSVQYICSSETKAKKLFDEKVKFSTQSDPEWLQPRVGSETKKGIEYYKQVAKGEREGMKSKLFIDAPSKDVVNAINPNLVLIDEAPSIGMFDIMMQEARPALFTFDPDTGERRMTKQLIAWGSSQEDEEGAQVSDEFENYWKALYANYQKGDYSDGFVPVFFDCWAIPGLTEEMYNNERTVAISKQKESALIRFRKHYPTCPDDVFLRNADTLIDFEDIQGQLERIYMLIKIHKLTLMKGYFEPIYDQNHPLPLELGSPYRIIGTNWVPVDDTELDKATVTIFAHPNYDWVNRYYQGTDPIVGTGGHSMFASAIWDNCSEKDDGKTIAAILNCRHTNYHKDYEQAYCLHLYYSNPSQNHFIPELLEINVGHTYHTYCEVMRYGYNMIANAELPDSLRCGEQIIGINKKSPNAPHILFKTKDLMFNYCGRIMIPEFWQQARTYVRDKRANVTVDRFSPNDKTDFDDILDGGTYAYICSQCSHREPKNIRTENQASKPQKQLVYRNGTLVYENVKKRA